MAGRSPTRPEGTESKEPSAPEAAKTGVEKSAASVPSPVAAPQDGFAAQRTGAGNAVQVPGVAVKNGLWVPEAPEGTALNVRKGLEARGATTEAKARREVDGLFARADRPLPPGVEVVRSKFGEGERVVLTRRDPQGQVLSVESAARDGERVVYDRADWTGQVVVRRGIESNPRASEVVSRTATWPAATLAPGALEEGWGETAERLKAPGASTRSEYGEERVTRKAGEVTVQVRTVDLNGERNVVEKHRTETEPGKLPVDVRDRLDPRRPVQVVETQVSEQRGDGPARTLVETRFAQGGQQVTQRPPQGREPGTTQVERYEGNQYTSQTFVAGQRQPVEVVGRIVDGRRLSETVERARRGVPSARPPGAKATPASSDVATLDVPPLEDILGGEPDVDEDDERPSLARSTPGDRRGVEALPGDRRGSDARLERPADARADSRPGDGRQVESRPGDPRGAEARSDRPQPSDARADSRPGDPRQPDSRPGDPCGADVRGDARADSRPGDPRQPDSRPGDPRGADVRGDARVDSRPGDARQGESLPGDRRGSDVRSDRPQPGDARQPDSRPGDVRQGEVLPGDRRGADARSDRPQPGDARDGRQESLPGDRRGSEVRSDRPQPSDGRAESRPGDARQIDSRPGDPRSTDARSERPQPADARRGSRPGDPRSADARSDRPQPTDVRSDSRPGDRRGPEGRPVPADARQADSKPGDRRAPDSRPGDADGRRSGADPGRGTQRGPTEPPPRSGDAVTRVDFSLDDLPPTALEELPSRERVEAELDAHGELSRRESEVVSRDGRTTRERYTRGEQQTPRGKEIRERLEVSVERPRRGSNPERFTRSADVRTRETPEGKQVVFARQRLTGPDGKAARPEEAPGFEGDGSWDHLWSAAEGRSADESRAPERRLPTLWKPPRSRAREGGWTYGKFQILRKLGTGGMGEVFLARTKNESGFEKDLVLKRILPHLADDAQFLERFLDEARICARLNHPNIAQMFELGQAEGTWYLAMEHVDGADLRRVVAEARVALRPIPIGVACRIVADVAAGLDCAHRAVDTRGTPLEIIHRDVSPHNILVGFDGAVKLIDFGVAKVASHLRAESHAGLQGKVSYMAPEQVGGRAIDPRADVFSLGVVFWELLTGRRLFDGVNEPMTILKVSECVVDPPSKHNPRIPPALDAVCLRALGKTPDARYSDAASFRRAIEALTVEQRINASASYLEVFLGDLFGVRPPARRATPYPGAVLAGTPLASAEVPPTVELATPAPPAPPDAGKRPASRPPRKTGPPSVAPRDGDADLHARPTRPDHRAIPRDPAQDPPTEPKFKLPRGR